MLKVGNRSIRSIFINNKSISKIYTNFKLVWKKVTDVLASCFSRGYWVNDQGWANDQGWKN